jgi:hypothetical protein
VSPELQMIDLLATEIAKVRRELAAVTGRSAGPGWDLCRDDDPGLVCWRREGGGRYATVEQARCVPTWWTAYLWPADGDGRAIATAIADTCSEVLDMANSWFDGGAE